MPQLNLFTVGRLDFGAGHLVHARPPQCGFSVVLVYPPHLQPVVKEQAPLAQVQHIARQACTRYQAQTRRSLAKHEALLAGMHKNGTPLALVRQAASLLQSALEAEAGTWEHLAAHKALALLQQLAKTKR